MRVASDLVNFCKMLNEREEKERTRKWEKGRDGEQDRREKKGKSV